MDDQLTVTSSFASLPDSQPDSRVFNNIRLYNHLIKHMEKYDPDDPKRWCPVDCMTGRFESRRSESSRKKMRQRLTAFLRWAREEQNKFISVTRAGYENNGHNEAMAAKIFDPITADAYERELVGSDLNRALHRKEISQETYDQIFQIVYPLLNGTTGEETPPTQSK